jgi:uncharacterized glyoxalase superfamily protein PhnB
MDADAYRKAYFVEPAPTARFAFTGAFGVTLFYEDFASAVAYFERVFGPPAYVEGSDTRGWRIGDGWLTLLKGENGTSRHVEVQLQVATPEEAERLQGSFIEAGGIGAAPSDQLMYEPIRSCPARDPFGVDWLVFSRQ